MDGPGPGAANMARDHALAERAAAGEAALRLYRWERPTVSFGRNEPARTLYDPAAASRAGVALVRRPTGGRAVLHWRELTYAVAVPLRALGGLRESYHRINRALVRGLASLGVPAEIAVSRGRAVPPDAGPCFRLPAEGEVTVAGRKLVGSAQARLGEALLQHGSILLADDQGLVEALGRGRGSTDPPATLSEVLGAEPAPAALEEAVLLGFREVMGGRWDAPLPDTGEAEGRLLRERYGRDEWTWRR